MAPGADATARTRKVAILVAEGVDSAALKPLREALEGLGLQCTAVGQKLGAVLSASKRQVAVDATFATMPSVLFDAVLLPAGREAAQTLAESGDALLFVREAFKHCKALCAVGEGADLLSASVGDAGTAGHAPPGVLRVPTPVTNNGDKGVITSIAKDFAAAVARHRHWERVTTGVAA